MMSNMEFQNDLDKLLAVMPPKVISFITHESLNDVIEIVLDIGRLPEVKLRLLAVKLLMMMI